MNKKTVSVFCGSLPGNNKVYCDEMRKLGRLLAQDDWRIVYGGIRSGMMRALADGVRQENGRVKAFIPQCASYKGRIIDGGIRQVQVDDKYERMRQMANSQAFVVGPGSFGTLCDVMNILERNYRAACLKQPIKPVFFINMNGIFDSLKTLQNDFIRQGFTHEETGRLIRCVETAEEAVNALKKAEKEGRIAETQGHVIRASGQLEYL